MTRPTFVVLAVVAAFPIVGRAQQNEPGISPGFTTTEFKELDYPQRARQAAVQGVVVVEATLPADGTVAAVTALSGPTELTPAALENARHWNFRPNPRNWALVVYDFRLLEWCRMSSSQFRVSQSGVATITACAPNGATPSATSELELLSFDEAPYPSTAQSARVQGFVVAARTLGEHGRVVSASAVAGGPLLIAGALENVKTWRFKPGPRRGVVVYDFRIEGYCTFGLSVFQV